MPIQPMLMLNLHRSAVMARYGELTNLVDVAELVRETKGAASATELLLNGIGLRVNRTLNDSYYQEALDYHLGMLLAYLNRPEEAVERLARSHTLPTSGGNLEFPVQVFESLRLHAERSKAAARGVPSILIASMPRAGSTSLTQSIAETLDAPILRASVGSFPNYILAPSWLNAFSPGGAVAHDHFGASPFNLRVLSDVGWRGDLFVLVRDPRAAAASLSRLVTLQGVTAPAEVTERDIVDLTLNAFIPWLEGWIAARADLGARVHWIRYQESTADMAGAVRRILDVFRPHYPALGEVLAGTMRTTTANFNRGDDDAWRSKVSAEGQRRLWEALSPQAIELLDLRP